MVSLPSTRSFIFFTFLFYALFLCSELTSLKEQGDSFLYLFIFFEDKSRNQIYNTHCTAAGVSVRESQQVSFSAPHVTHPMKL